MTVGARTLVATYIEKYTVRVYPASVFPAPCCTGLVPTRILRWTLRPGDRTVCPSFGGAANRQELDIHIGWAKEMVDPDMSTRQVLVCVAPLLESSFVEFGESGERLRIAFRQRLMTVTGTLRFSKIGLLPKILLDTFPWGW